MEWRLAQSLVVLRNQVNAYAPNRGKSSDGTIGNAEHASRSSDHNPYIHDKNGQPIVTAVDFTHDPVHGFDSYAFAEMLRVNRDSRVKYIISNRKIANSTSVTKGGKKYAPWEWSPYPVPPNLNPHDHHCHISVKSDQEHYDDASKWVIDPAVPAPITPDDQEKSVIAQLPVLRSGARGADVRRLQDLLVKSGIKVVVDGVFGPDTGLGVTAFQRKSGLDPDAVVGGYTWHALQAGMA